MPGSRGPSWRPEFQARGISLPREGTRQVRAKLYRVEFDVGRLWARELLERRCSNHDRPVAVPSRPMQQGGGALNQALPHPRFVFLNNRTPNCFQRLVREPEFAGVEELARVLEVAAAIFRIHARPRLTRSNPPWQAAIVPTTISAGPPAAPACATNRSPASTASTLNIPTPNTNRQ